MAKVIGTVAEKGGVGKSSICFNLAWELMERGRRVLMIDLDGQRANLTFIAGMEKKKAKTMYDVLVNGEDIRRACVIVEDSLHIVPATHAVTQIHQSNSSMETMAKAIAAVRNHYDYIFIDVPPTPGHSHALCLAVADHVLITMLPDIASLEANLGIVETIRAAQAGPNPKLNVLGFVFNKHTWRTNLSRNVNATAEKMAASVGSKVFKAKLRNAVAISEAVGEHAGITSVAPKSNGSDDVRALADEFEREVKNYEQ